MNHKVLLADDSLTIQKVIKITLANQPYEIVDASNEEELFSNLPVVQPKIVFLDFNLSEKYTGYELTSKIKSLLPSTKVLLLLGTFDSVDDAAFEKCGASDKIVKPFDSNKFIAICKGFIDSFEDVPEQMAPVTVTKAPAPSENAEDQWTVSHTSEHKLETKTSQPQAKAKPALNPLHEEISDWGMSVPGIIDDPNGEDLQMPLPPVMGAKVAGPKLPESSDLDYPTVEELAEKPAPKKSNLISIDSFRNEEATAEFQLQGNYIPDESDISSIHAQIADEVEKDLWKVDEFENLKNEISSRVEQMSSGFKSTTNDFEESLFPPVDDEDAISWKEFDSKDQKSSASQFNQDQLPHALDNLHGAELEELIKKYVKEYMDEMFKNKVEKIAWEIIPDLAENLIRQELSKIADKILKETK